VIFRRFLSIYSVESQREVMNRHLQTQTWT